MRCLILTGLLGVLLLGGLGCGVETSWVKASRATYNVVAPAHKKYVEADKELTEAQKKNRLLLLQSWEARIVEWEKEVE